MLSDVSLIGVCTALVDIGVAIWLVVISYMASLVLIAVDALELGVHPDTLRLREKEGRTEPAERTPLGRCGYDLAKLKRLGACDIALTPR
ncbi:hypothetical protein SAMN02745225_01186 [Ferrithrix thermotolerans DSM 19514]|uniref:Uncharacterized protein n=1 Tax=Ferrithrix thermotolerans DSM 19514 TaxID=1121881 RepID=A0A1M4V555_9ACTN|nr:hypothetical protein SAMN02745225_01186 [Ferrithrix thermotolerans DSM 19514]